jgi:hypothetical protein
MTSPRPPSYVNTPVPIAYADVDDALIVTMTRILGLCWSHDYERTPALTPNELSDLTRRPRTTLYRHLGILERELGWLQDFDRDAVEPLLRRECDFVLHGTTRLEEFVTELPGIRPVILGAGACLTRRDHPDSYNMVRLDLALGTGTVYLRSYSAHPDGFWKQDTHTYGQIPDGMWFFPIAHKLVG